MTATTAEHLETEIRTEQATACADVLVMAVDLRKGAGVSPRACVVTSQPV